MASFMAQFTEISNSLGRGLQRQAHGLERLAAELRFANQLCAAHPERAGEWQERILEAGRLVQEGLQGPAVDLEERVARGEAILAPVGEVAKAYTLLCVSHAHIDMNWMWSWPETVAVTNDTFQTMLALMDEFPNFIYSQSQASTYRLIEVYNPPMFEAIRRRVKEGRWEVTASQWVEGDKNMSSGESLSRHLLYAREYFQQRFDLSSEDVQVDFEPDTFGHAATVPTILARGGVKYYYHCRGSRGPHLYWWIGPDGSRVLAFNDIQWYMTGIEPHIADALIEYSLSTGLRAMPVLYGVGDHGGGPTRRDLRRIQELDTWPVYPRVQCSSLHGFFRMAEKAIEMGTEGVGTESHPDGVVGAGLRTRPMVPEIAGERNFVFAGCYTTQARIKWANRHGENLLYTAEAAATLGDRVAGVAYPHQNLDEAWKNVLFNQFHDILPGSGVRDTRHFAMGRAQETQAAAGMARSNALRALGQRVNTQALRAGLGQGDRDEAGALRAMGAGVGFATGMGGESGFSVARSNDRVLMVFNPLPYPRCEVVEAQLWDVDLDESQLVVMGEGLSPQRVQVLERGRYWGHEFLKVAFPVEVPALGYRTVFVSDRMAELGLSPEEQASGWHGGGGALRTITPDDLTLENEWLKVQLEPASGGVVHLLDKRDGREWVPEGEAAGILQYILEANQGMTAWVIGQFLQQEDILSGGTLKKVHGGPYVQSYRWTRLVHGSPVDLDITLRRGVPRLEFRLRVDWREVGSKERIPNLRVRFPLAVQQPRPRYEIPFGSIQRDLLGGEEVPAQRWADLSGADGAGVTLVNTGKYGFSAESDWAGCALSMTLLRASIDPDPLPDMGEHVIEYALLPHGAGWTVGDCARVGEEMNVPLVVASVGLHEGDLPTSLSFLALDSNNVRLAAVKESQDGQSIVLRLYEVEGRETEVALYLASALAPEGASVVEVDALERPLAAKEATKVATTVEQGVLQVKVPAYGITAVRVSK